MPRNSFNNPHDKLFKSVFADPVNAAAYLREQIPEAVAEQVDWSQLKLRPGTYVDSQFRQSESDLLFFAPFQGKEVGLYLLFEHQSTKDKFLALRLLRYMLRIWERHLETNPGQKLPVVLPVVVAQNQSRWQLASNFSSLFDFPSDLQAELSEFLPDFTFRLFQLAEIPFDSIVGTPTGILAFRFLKAQRSGEITHDVVWDESLLTQIPRAIYELLLLYFFNADLDKEAIHRRIVTLRKEELKEQAMTYAELLHKEGRQEAHREARQEAIIVNLQTRFEDVPVGLIEELQKINSLEKLQSLQRVSILCTTIESFAESL